MQKLVNIRRVLTVVTLVLLAASNLGSAARYNVTVDDQNGDAVTGAKLVYSPDGVWQQGSTCSSCFARPDSSKVLDGTWHDTTHGISNSQQNSITYFFSGA